MVIAKNNKVLILAGTGDAKNLVDYIFSIMENQNAAFLVSVVNENAAVDYLKKKIPVRFGALDKLQMKKLVEHETISVIIDATHPFASEVSQNAMITANESKINYIRYERPKSKTGKTGVDDTPVDFVIPDENDDVLFAENHEEAAQFIVSLQKKLNKNLTVMLATGAKSLKLYCQKFSTSPGINIVVRLLPSVENLELCTRCKIPQSNIIAIQGPFGKELNKELFLKYNIDLLILKESGSAGSTEEKILAARELGIKTIVIHRPVINYQNLCRSFDEVQEKLGEFL
jgi:precorrin-6A/cobalt-precorrin-6A reductase